MSKAAMKIRRGLKQAISYAKGTAAVDAYRVHVPVHVDVSHSREAGDDAEPMTKR